MVASDKRCGEERESEKEGESARVIKSQINLSMKWIKEQKRNKQEQGHMFTES